MTDKLIRTQFIKRCIKTIAVAACTLAPTFSASAQAQVTTDDDRIEIREQDDTVEVRIDGELFTRLNYKDSSKPYLYPIVGPAGAPMTRSFPMVDGVAGESRDHPHHQSLWFAHGNINGVDYWHSGGDRGHTVLNGAPDIKGDELFFVSNLLAAGDAKRPEAVTETRLSFSIDSANARGIDYEVVFLPTAQREALLFGDTKEGTMAIRLHPALRLKGDVATGHCINSEGDTDGDCWGKRAKWVAYWGVIDGQTCGVAVFDHPTNLRHPTWWHARDYGLVAANPFGVSDFENRRPRGDGDYTLQAGQTLELSYRFVFFAGTAEEADIAEKYDAWVAETTTDDEEPEDE